MKFYDLTFPRKEAKRAAVKRHGWDGNGWGTSEGELSCSLSLLEKVVGLTGFVIIHVFIASFSPAHGERNQIVNAKFTRPVNAMPMSTPYLAAQDRLAM